ncbi:SHOCT domain-containing protein [Desulfofustis limnaeus]|uniref:SHOCT domain-containing protein n=1 Tax=Desulfofustis limnaeus TaxID=2740163 RepID=A0ABM7WDW9_9BACT|nr:SHOCT domain-containing protein [Desulfofustis limnaeus]BDD89184.1 hypothetical protein DPPLL_35490 [Desulfofustis limnaeus]
MGEFMGFFDDFDPNFDYVKGVPIENQVDSAQIMQNSVVGLSATAIISAVVYLVLRPKGKAKTPIDLGGKWAAAGGAIGTLWMFPSIGLRITNPLSIHIEDILLWIFVSIFVGFLFFCVGWLIGKKRFAVIKTAVDSRASDGRIRTKINPSSEAEIGSIEQKLINIKSLLEKGLISDEDYKMKKDEILRKLS